MVKQSRRKGQRRPKAGTDTAHRPRKRTPCPSPTLKPYYLIRFRFPRAFIFLHQSSDPKVNFMRALPSSLLCLSLFFLLPLHSHQASSGFCDQEQQPDIAMAAAAGATLGGPRDSDADIDSLARFAVDHHNNKENALLELVRVVKAQEQVVAGTLHHLTLEVLDAGEKKIYEAKIWVKPWMDFKEVQEFKHVGDAPAFTSSDLGAKKGDPQALGSRSVPVHDPIVQDAAHHAIKTIQQRSNSLVPYELSEIVHANAEVGETTSKLDMLLKVKRGDKEEKYRVEVHRNSEGGFQLNKMESDA